MIWDIPIRAGCVRRFVSWRASGIVDDGQFTPQAFNLPDQA